MFSAPSTHTDLRAWLGLTLVPGISLGKQRALLDAFGTVQAVFDVPAPAVSSVVGAEAAQLLTQGPQASLIDATLQWLARPGCRLVTIRQAEYPDALREIANAPLVLYVQGRIELLNTPALAIVGSRNATPGGSSDAQAFARSLSEAGLVIVSGLALGIDAAAHRGGLAGAASSIAVMGTGPDIMYPRRNVGLARELAAKGCLVSEFPVGMASLAGNFPRRNRLISGLSRGVLVVEAAMRSGSLVTARLALDQNREVFAIPGSIHSPLSKGCHWLIKEGAKLVETADDVLAELGIRVAGAPPPEGDETPGQIDPLLAAMGFAPATVDQLAQRTGLDAATLAAQLARLEVEAGIAALPGGRFQRIEKHVIK